MATLLEKTPHHFSRKVRLRLERDKRFVDDQHKISWRLLLSDRRQFFSGCSLKVEIAFPKSLILIEKLSISPCPRRGDGASTSAASASVGNSSDENGDLQQIRNLYCSRSHDLDSKWQTAVELVFDRSAQYADQFQFDVSFRRISIQRDPEPDCSCKPRLTPAPNLPATYATLSADLAYQFNDADTADISFTVGNAIIPAHKWILQARLPYFRSMFSSQMIEATTNKVKIDDADPDAFRHMLKFVYSGQLPEDLTTSASTLLPLADKYGIDELKEACAGSLKKSLKRVNAVDTLILASLYGCSDLKDSCFEEIAYWKSSMDEAEFEPLKQHPDLLVKILTFKATYESDYSDISDSDTPAYSPRSPAGSPRRYYNRYTPSPNRSRSRSRSRSRTRSRSRSIDGLRSPSPGPYGY